MYLTNLAVLLADSIYSGLPITLDVFRATDFYFFESSDFYDIYPFTGAILYDEWNDDDCPLESISRLDPFEFTQESQIIYIQSVYFKNSTRKHPCRWRFVGPESYGFKIVLTEMALFPGTTLTVQNSTNYNIIE